MITTVISFFCSSGPARPAEVALQHEPSAAEPPSADEGGRRRGCQGQGGERPVLDSFKLVCTMKTEHVAQRTANGRGGNDLLPEMYAGSLGAQRGPHEKNHSDEKGLYVG